MERFIDQYVPGLLRQQMLPPLLNPLSAPFGIEQLRNRANGDRSLSDEPGRCPSGGHQVASGLSYVYVDRNLGSRAAAASPNVWS